MSLSRIRNVSAKANTVARGAASIAATSPKVTLSQTLAPFMNQRRVLSTEAAAGSGASRSSAEGDASADKAELRRAFFRRRHIGRDHIIRAQHYDLRIAAIRLTDAANDAARRHGMNLAEAQLWAPLAAGTALYASTLRGEERIRTQIALADPDYVVPAEGQGEGQQQQQQQQQQASMLTDSICAEGFAVGELRGFSRLDLTRSKLEEEKKKEEAAGTTSTAEGEEAKRVMTSPTGAVLWAGSQGLFEVKKTLYGLAQPYVTRIMSSSDPATDWQTFFDQSEQVPTFVHFHVDYNEHYTPASPSSSPSATAGKAASTSTATIPTTTTTGSTTTSTSAEGPIPFCGAVLIQVIAGPPCPEIKAAIEQEDAERVTNKQRAKNASLAAESDTASSSPSTSTSTSSAVPEAELATMTLEQTEAQGAGAEEGVNVNETEDARIKRLELERMQKRAFSLDMRHLMETVGVAGYVNVLLGETVPKDEMHGGTGRCSLTVTCFASYGIYCCCALIHLHMYMRFPCHFISPLSFPIIL